MDVSSMTKNVIKKKSPGGRLLVHKVKKRSQKSYCSSCGTDLQRKAKKNTKSAKSVTRPYGGEICHSCLKTTIQSVEL
jgi:ribosomal protein L34E